MKSIICNSESVRAILDGRKTQTRRVVTRMTSNVDGHGRANKEFWEQLDFSDYYLDSGPSPAGNPGPYLKIYNPTLTTRHRIYPIWFPGDKLWVRETWKPFISVTDPRYGIRYKADKSRVSKGMPVNLITELVAKSTKWRASIHMPIWASRITLEIKDVRVERVQDISFADVIAEGFPFEKGSEVDSWYKSAFEGLWDSINLKRGFGWDTNPWVWVKEFEII